MFLVRGGEKGWQTRKLRPRTPPRKTRRRNAADAVARRNERIARNQSPGRTPGAIFVHRYFGLTGYLRIVLSLSPSTLLGSERYVSWYAPFIPYSLSSMYSSILSADPDMEP